MGDQEDLSRTMADLDLARSGDEAAANRLWERYYERLVPAVRVRLGPKLRQKVETLDILQSAFLEAVRGVEEREFASEGHFRSWLSRLVENRIRKKARFFSRKRRDVGLETPAASVLGEEMPMPISGPRPVSLVEKIDLQRQLEAALDRLPAGLQEVLVLRYFEGLSYAEIGERVDRTEEGARKLVKRGVELLVAEMGA
jgi:RNA polymerase sigma-70 factor (ECF subfamily)